MAAPRPSAKFLKSKSNRDVESDATAVVLGDRRFQRLELATKRRLLELLNVRGAWTHKTFDLVMTTAGIEPITADNVERHLNEITLVEVKSTRKAIRDAALNGFFFGATKTEFELAAALGDRFRYAFVVLNANNAHGRPFFVLLSHADVERKTRTQRVQYQVNFKSDMRLDGSEEVFVEVPALIAAEAEEELQADE